MPCLHPVGDVTCLAGDVTPAPDHPRWSYATIQLRCDATRLPYDPGSRARSCPVAVAPRPPRRGPSWVLPVAAPRRPSARQARSRGGAEALGGAPKEACWPRRPTSRARFPDLSFQISRGGRASSRLRPARGRGEATRRGRPWRAARNAGEAARRCWRPVPAVPARARARGGAPAPLCRPRGWRARSRRVTDSCRRPRPGAGARRGWGDGGGGRSLAGASVGKKAELGSHTPPRRFLK